MFLSYISGNIITGSILTLCDLLFANKEAYEKYETLEDIVNSVTMDYDVLLDALVSYNERAPMMIPCTKCFERRISRGCPLDSRRNKPRRRIVCKHAQSLQSVNNVFC